MQKKQQNNNQQNSRNWKVIEVTGKSDSFQETMINHIYKITLKIFHVPKK